MKSFTRRKNKNAGTELLNRLKKTASREIAVGFPKGKAQAYPDGTSVIDVAAQNVYGTPTIPQRDFMTLASSDIREKTRPIIKRIVKEANKKGGNERVVDSLQNAAGEVAKSAIQKAIIDLDTPPNAPSTIDAKGSSNPLIDTGHMKDSVTFDIREKSK